MCPKNDKLFIFTPRDDRVASISKWAGRASSLINNSICDIAARPGTRLPIRHSRESLWPLRNTLPPIPFTTGM
jgi:hypothetical protein